MEPFVDGTYTCVVYKAEILPLYKKIYKSHIDER